MAAMAGTQHFTESRIQIDLGQSAGTVLKNGIVGCPFIIPERYRIGRIKYLLPQLPGNRESGVHLVVQEFGKVDSVRGTINMDDLHTDKSSIGDEGIVCLADKLKQEISISGIVAPYRIVKNLGILDDLHPAAAFRSILLLLSPDALGYINNHYQNHNRDYDQPVQYQEGLVP